MTAESKAPSPGSFEYYELRRKEKNDFLDRTALELYKQRKELALWSMTVPLGHVALAPMGPPSAEELTSGKYTFAVEPGNLFDQCYEEAGELWDARLRFLKKRHDAAVAKKQA